MLFTSMNLVRSERPRLAPVVRHSTLVLLLQVVLLSCGVVNNFLVARMVGAQGKGILYVLQLICNAFGVSALHFSFGFAAIYFLGQDRGYSRGEIAAGIFLPSIVVGSVPACVLFVAWPWSHQWLTQSLPSTYLWLAMFSIPLAVLTFNVSQYSLGRHRVGTYNLLGMAPPALFTVFLIAMLLFHRISIPVLVACWFISVAVPAIYAFRIILSETGGAFLPKPEFLRKVLQFGWRSHLGGVTQQLQHRSPVLLVACFLPISQLGIYSLAVGLAELLWYFPNAISIVLMPHVASSTEQAARRGTPVFCRIALGVTFVLAIGLSLVTAIVVPWLLPAFRPSLLPFYILMPGVVLATVFRVLASDFNGRGQPLRTFQPAFTALVIEVVAGAVLIPRFGLLGAASVTSAGYAINSFMYGCSYRRLTGIGLLQLIVPQRQDFVRLRSTAVALWNSVLSSGTLAPAVNSIE